MSAAPLRTIRRARSVIAFTAAIVLALSLSACSSTTGSETASNSADGAFPVTITHALGETTISKRPQRVVTLGWYSQDVAAAVGVVPVGVENFSWVDGGDAYLPWFKDRVNELGGELPEIIRFTDTGDYNYEQILALRPDLIIAAHSGLTEVMYQRLSEIAPTVAYQRSTWASERDELTRTVATALGEQDKADGLLKAADDAIAETAAAHPEFKGVTFTYGWYLPEGGTSLDLYLPRDPRTQMTEQLGFTLSPQVAAAEANSKEFTVPISLEKLGDVQSDFHIGWTNSDDDLARTVKNPLVARWSPIARGSYYFFPGTDGRLAWATTAPTVLSIPATIGDVANALATGLERD